jgi:hypothetical protein
MLELKLDLRCLTDIDEYSAEPQEPRLNLDRPPLHVRRRFAPYLRHPLRLSMLLSNILTYSISLYSLTRFVVSFTDEIPTILRNSTPARSLLG